MQNLAPLEPVDYLVLGHLSRDLTPDGPRLGGTAAYASLTAWALGLRVGIITAWDGEKPDILDGIQTIVLPAEHSTTFENIPVPGGRVQYLYHLAPSISSADIPEVWWRTPIIHLGPIAQEVNPVLDNRVSPQLLGLTAQGWLRSWDTEGRIHACAWPDGIHALSKAGAVVISIEDVDGDEKQIEAMALAAQVLAVTEGPSGARLYWHGDSRRFLAPALKEVDPTGAGDIFAAAFFTRLYATRDPWEAARFATQLAAFSVTRRGLDGIPTREEIQTCMVEVL